MSESWRAMVAVAGLIIFTARAEVYRCQQGDKVTYTDRPCTVGAAPASLPPLTTVNPERHPADLASQYDRDAAAADAREKKAQASRDRAAAEREATDEAVRKGVAQGRIVVGMSRDQVSGILGRPDQITNQNGINEKWIYNSGFDRRTVTFKNGVVTSDASRSSTRRRRR